MYCLYPWQEAYIDVYGNVRCCCFMYPYLGNLLDYCSFLELWNNTTAVEIRQAIIDNKIHPNCNNISCPHYGKYDVFNSN